MRGTRAIAAVLAPLATALLASCGGGGSEDKEARKATPRTELPAKKTPKPKNPVITNSIGMKLALIEPGRFLMGSARGGTLARRETPVHEVTITRAFYFSVTEVTQAQFHKVMGSGLAKPAGPNQPARTVSFYDARNFCRKLAAMESMPYRLPTEAEWEYACRAGTTTEYSFGDAASDLGEFAWFKKNSKKRPHDVGQKKPNPWGLYDVHGNVWEWVADRYARYTAEAQTDPRGPDDRGLRVLRGGSWHSAADRCRCAFRGRDTSGAGVSSYGFRVVREVP